MAGHGPAPAEKRRRRNEPARGEWVDLPPLEGPILPELPEIEGGWRIDTLAAWEAWRSDPVTSQYSPADIAYALDTIKLHQVMTAQSASEVRLRMDALGLTPKGKRDLRWRVTEEAEPLRTPAQSSRKVGGERRGRLSLVK